MKKAIGFLIVAALIVAAIVLLTRRPDTPAGSRAAASLVGADTVVLLELPDIRGSADRWNGTALAAIAREPEVAAFLERPLEALRGTFDTGSWFGPLAEVDATNAFLAVGSLGQPMPTVLGGFRFRGDPEAVGRALGPAREVLLREFPEGRADLIRIAGHPVEIYAADQWEILQAVVDGWCLVSNDRDLLAGALGRLERSSEVGPSLADQPDFREVAAVLPATREAFTYLSMPPILRKLEEFAISAGQPLDPARREELASIRAVGLTTTFEGRDLRDVSYILYEGADRIPPGRLADPGLELTTPDTLLFLAGTLVIPERIEPPDATLDQTGLLGPVGSVIRQLEDRGLGATALREAFGPAASAQLDWPEGATKPTVLVAVDVRDGDIAGRLLTELTSGNLGLPVFDSLTVGDGVSAYGFPVRWQLPVRPVVALTPERLLVSDEAGGLRGLPGQAGADRETLADGALFQEAMGRVPAGDVAIGFMDTAGVYTRTYSALRPTLMLVGGMLPGVGQYADLSKLPPTEAVARHLGPISMSQSVHGSGVLFVSTGPFTMNHMLVGGVAGALGAGMAVSGYAELFGGPGN